MNTVELEVQTRSGTGKGANRRLRAEGTIPGVVYGYGQEPVNVHFRATPLVALLKGPMGPNTLIQIKMDGTNGPVALVREYQLHPVRRTLLHVDFMRVDPKKYLIVEVPVEIVGRSEAEKAGGKRRVVTPAIKVRCLPAHIPQAITYDVSSINKSVVTYVNDLIMPEGVEAVYRRPFPIVSITALKAVAKAEPDEKDAKKKKK